MSLCFLSQNHNASRTDEGVCPYFEALSGSQNYSLISSREALLPLGEAGWGFQPMVSVYTLSILFDY